MAKIMRFTGREGSPVQVRPAAGLMCEYLRRIITTCVKVIICYLVAGAKLDKMNLSDYTAMSAAPQGRGVYRGVYTVD